MNSSKRAVWVNSKPSVGHAVDRHRQAEIEMRLLDAHLREVLDSCSDMRAAPKQSDFKALQPKQNLEIVFDFDPHCYSLVPGEKLRMYVSYMSLDSWPDPEPGASVLEKPVGAGWQKIVVPAGWKDTATPPDP